MSMIFARPSPARSVAEHAGSGMARSSSVGNQARLRRLATAAVQPKLRVGEVDDPLEHEADRMADRVMTSGAPPPADAPRDPTPTVRRACAACEQDEPTLQRKAAAPDSVHATLQGPGRPLPPETRGFFEPRFGRDLGAVRVHDGDAAANSARDVNALAYTVGDNIVFGKGQYAPGSASGRHLLAHELAHTLQQTDAPVLRRKVTAPTSDGAVQISNMINDFCPASATAAGTDVTAAGKACSPPAAGPGCKCACEAMTSTTKTYDIDLVPMIPLPVSKTLADKTTTMVPQLADGPHTNNPLCTPLTKLVMPRFDSTAVFGSFDAGGNAVIASTPRILAHELCGHAVSCFGYLGDSGNREGHDKTIQVENAIYSSQPQRGAFKNKRQGESFFRAPGETKLVFSLKDGLHYEDVP